jgi:tripartite-type tricarboxylate transporter receptor subunit TctC
VQINEGLKTPELKAALARVSNEPVGGTPQDFANMIKGDIDKWAPVVKALGLPPQ